MIDHLVTLTIDGRSVSVPRGTLVVEAAKQAGIEIPVFCYHPKLKPVGACRMCLVEIEKLPRLQTACTTPVGEGMVVASRSEAAVTAQNGVIELLLANHPLDCPVCDKGGECPLQDNTFNYGLGVSRFTEEKRKLEKALPLSDRIVLDRERCIMCYRCVRFHQEIPGDEALAAIDRGGQTVIGLLPGERYDSPFSGNTIDLCPVGALTSRQYRFRARPWDLERAPSVCVGCAVGCNVEIHSRKGEVQRLVPRENLEINDEWLCDHGRFDTLSPLRERRLLEPMVRRNGRLEPVDWDTALDRAAELLSQGPSAFGVGPAVTNEAIWLMATIARQVPGLNSAHSSDPTLAPTSGGSHSAYARRLNGGSTLTAWPLRGTMSALTHCRSVVLVGIDPWTELPILSLWLRRAALAGARIVVIGPENGLERDTAHWIRVEAGHEEAVVRGLLEDRQRSDLIPAGLRSSLLGPVSVLAGQRVAQDATALAAVRELAERLQAGRADVPVGVPALTANGRGLADLAPELALTDPAASAGAQTLLLVGEGPWPLEGAGVRIVATTRPIGDDDRADVALPLAHAYEQEGSLTNFEGRVQALNSGAAPPGQAWPDWVMLAGLATRLGVVVPTDLASIQAVMAAALEHSGETLGPAEETLARA